MYTIGYRKKETRRYIIYIQVHTIHINGRVMLKVPFFRNVERYTLCALKVNTRLSQYCLLKLIYMNYLLPVFTILLQFYISQFYMFRLKWRSDPVIGTFMRV